MPKPKAYPTLEGDLIVLCPVCEKQVPMEHYFGNMFQLLFHNDSYNSPCNGTGRRACLQKVSIKEVR